MSSLPPSIRTPSGNPTFVHLDQKHLCQVCKKVVRDAMQTSCGHRICETCIDVFFKDTTGHVLCPAGEEDCLPQHRTDITPDPGGRREISSLKVYCDFKRYGCPSIMKWKDLENHKMTCEHQPVKCENPGCGEAVPKKLEDQHKRECQFRLEPCPHCKGNVPLAHLKQHEKEECPRVVIQCPYQCDYTTYRNEMGSHIEECPNKPIGCDFKSVGCTFEGNKEQVAYHLEKETTRHVELVTVFVLRAEANTLRLQRELQEAKKELDDLKTKMERATKSNREMTLKMVALGERVIHLEKQTETYGKKDDVSRHEQDVRLMKTSLTQVRAQVIQLERAAQETAAAGPTTSTSSVEELKRKLEEHDTQLTQSNVQFAELDLRFQLLETASFDGTLLWKVRDYSRRKLEAAQGKTLSLYSQPFYTHRYGYKMCARVYLNGDGMGKGSHMSLFFVVMRGEFDNLLAWPFQQKVTMTLLDQENHTANLSDTFRPDPTSSSFKKPTTDMNIASGCPLFVSHAILETPKYIKDDIVMLKFEIDLTNIKHP